MRFPSLVLRNGLTVGQLVVCADDGGPGAAAAIDASFPGAGGLQGQVVLGLVNGDGVLVAAAGRVGFAVDVAADAMAPRALTASSTPVCLVASPPQDHTLVQMHFDILAGDDGFGAAVESDASVAEFPASSCCDRFAVAPAAALL